LRLLFSERPRRHPDLPSLPTRRSSDLLIDLASQAVDAGEAPGWALRAGLALEAALAAGRDRPVPMNIDGATAIVYSELGFPAELDRKSTRPNSSHVKISYAVFCLKKKK